MPIFKDSDPNVPNLHLHDGGVFYADGRPVTDPAHLAVLPETLRPKPAYTCGVCGKTVKTALALRGHARSHKPVAA